MELMWMKMKDNGDKLIAIPNYFKSIASKESIDKIPTLLSFANLSLSIYGISSLVPGDVFRVDYLPERERKILYFQLNN